jgi:GNAT superfamily N-acetyltransferase
MNPPPRRRRIRIRNTTPADFEGIRALTREVYKESSPWNIAQLSTHLELFPEGQWVAVDDEERVLGMAASLVICFREYEHRANWTSFTERGFFTNHDPQGRTLYGAEVMVSPFLQRSGVGSKLYAARRSLVQRLGLLRIVAGARLRGYHRHASRLSAQEYTRRVVEGKLKDPTLSFQLRHGFGVFGVVEGYLGHDPESLGYAALIQWLNPAFARAQARVTPASSSEPLSPGGAA